MEKKIKEFGKMALYSSILLGIFLLFDLSPIDIPENAKIFTGIIFLILGLFWLISFFGFVTLLIYKQYKNKMIFWATINVLLTIFVLWNSYNNWGLIGLIPLIISVVSYYFIYIGKRFRNKK